MSTGDGVAESDGSDRAAGSAPDDEGAQAAGSAQTDSGFQADELPLAPLASSRSERSPRLRRGVAALTIVAVVAAVGLLVSNLLGDAALFFYNADEALQRRDDLGSDRFRLQGTPSDEPPLRVFWQDRPALAFTVEFNSAEVDVIHLSDPPELFQPGVPVVLEGAWQNRSEPGVPAAASGSYFVSDRMLVKHDNDYRSRDEYDERITEADQSEAFGLRLSGL